jgi:hypothetical protein
MSSGAGTVWSSPDMQLHSAVDLLLDHAALHAGRAASPLGAHLPHGEYEPPKMSLFPKVGGQSVAGDGVGSRVGSRKDAR